LAILTSSPEYGPSLQPCNVDAKLMDAVEMRFAA